MAGDGRRDEWRQETSGFRGGRNQDQTTSDGAALRKWMRMHECIHIYACVYVCACVCCDRPVSSTPPLTAHPLLHTPQLLPHTWPHPTQPCGAFCKKTRMRRGTVFHPCGGQSMWICQGSLGPSSLGSSAQQAPTTPPEDGGLWNEPPDSRLQRHAFVWGLWGSGGIDDWLHLCVREHATLEMLNYSYTVTRTTETCHVASALTTTT